MEHDERSMTDVPRVVFEGEQLLGDDQNAKYSTEKTSDDVDIDLSLPSRSRFEVIEVERLPEPEGSPIRTEIREHSFLEVCDELSKWEEKTGMSSIELFKMINLEPEKEEELDEWLSFFFLFLRGPEVRAIACK